jgi:hypothetical protein
MTVTRPRSGRGVFTLRIRFGSPAAIVKKCLFDDGAERGECDASELFVQAVSLRYG